MSICLYISTSFSLSRVSLKFLIKNQLNVAIKTTKNEINQYIILVLYYYNVIQFTSAKMQFVQQIEYPKDFPALMMDFSREVLREQPENIYEFAVKHFSSIKRAQQANE